MQKQIYHVICPRCGEEFDEREKFCPYCQAPNRKIVCKTCGAQINAKVKRCPACGAKKQKEAVSARKSACRDSVRSVCCQLIKHDFGSSLFAAKL